MTPAAKATTGSASRKRPLPRSLSNISIKQQRRNQYYALHTRITPWIDLWEWQAVGKALCFAADCLGAQQHPSAELTSTDSLQMSLSEALERVNVWKTRTTQMPHAVESTASLAQVLHRESSTTVLTSMELRLSYATAIIRAINGLADVLQQQRAQAASVAILCRQLGIPSWLVDVRHEATHNQLPTLSVLRMAAISLLQYFRAMYWERLEESWQQDMEHAMNSLRAYESTATAGMSSKATSAAAEGQDISAMQTNSKDIYEDDESESSSDGEDAWNSGLESELWGSSLGTTTNRFAVLQEKKKPAKKAKVEAKKVKKKKKRDPENPTISTRARMYTKSKVPIDVAYHAALRFLVWGQSGDGCGCLIPAFVTELPVSDNILIEVRRQYEPLLRAFAKEWPGFLHALLVHLVDSILSLEWAAKENVCGDKVLCKLFSLDFWVRHLLSRSFLAYFDHSLKKNDSSSATEDSKSPAPLSSLRQMQYPLNALCDRCVNASRGGSLSRTTSDGLADLFVEILSDQRVSDFGIDLTASTIALDDASARPVSLRRPEPDSPQRLSLAEIEAMLEASTAAVPSKNSHTIGRKAEMRPVASLEHEPELADLIKDDDAMTKSENIVSVENEESESTHLVGAASISDENENGHKSGTSGTKVEQSKTMKNEESILNRPASQTRETAEVNSQSVRTIRPAWVECATWDACAIGTLPGYPS